MATAAVAYSGEAMAEQGWRRVGTLDCTMGPSIGLLYGDRQKARCSFLAAETKRRYVGRPTRPGLNLGISPGSKLIWVVFARSTPAAAAKTGLLGSYSGACSDTASVPAIDAKALAGGPHNSVCLQPLASGSQRNPNLAAEISALKVE